MARGARLTLRLHLPRFEVFDPEDELTWDGRLASARFAVTAPPALPPGAYPGQLAVLATGVRIAGLSFTVEVGPQAGPGTPVPLTCRRYRRVFASYSSGDADEVLGRIQGMQKVAPYLDVFLDKAALRSGERWRDRLTEEIRGRDALFLFWSRRASVSQWVAWEWRTALRERGLDHISPVPLVPAREVPPPPELAELHFDDWHLAYRRGQVCAGIPTPPETGA